jgi:hypothetical protein
MWNHYRLIATAVGLFMAVVGSQVLAQDQQKQIGDFKILPQSFS